MMACTNLSLREYVRDAMLGRMTADIDHHFEAGDPRREQLFKRLGELR
jgi:tRNA nucleotidyltransferase/poly(A) polymerase